MAGSSILCLLGEQLCFKLLLDTFFMAPKQTGGDTGAEGLGIWVWSSAESARGFGSCQVQLEIDAQS